MILRPKQGSCIFENVCFNRWCNWRKFERRTNDAKGTCRRNSFADRCLVGHRNTGSCPENLIPRIMPKGQYGAILNHNVNSMITCSLAVRCCDPRSVSRVWAARHQLAKADRHKDEAIAQVRQKCVRHRTTAQGFRCENQEAEAE